MQKALIAFFLGVFSFFLFMAIGETLLHHYGENVGLPSTFIFMTAYFFICQFFLSRGNPHAFPKDWTIMLVLDAVPFAVFILMVLIETQEGTLIQGIGILFSCCVGTLAGSIGASKVARRKAGRQ